MTLADRVVLLNDGDIQQVGTPLELYERPATKFVAGFIGSPEMNFLNGHIESVIGGLEFVGPEEIRIPVSEKDAMNLSAGQYITLGMRPQNLVLSEKGIEAQFRDVEVLGTETHVFSRCGDTFLTSVLSGVVTFSRGAKLFLLPEQDHLHFFDTDSGHRLN